LTLPGCYDVTAAFMYMLSFKMHLYTCRSNIITCLCLGIRMPVLLSHQAINLKLRSLNAAVGRNTNSTPKAPLESLAQGTSLFASD